MGLCSDEADESGQEGTNKGTVLQDKAEEVEDLLDAIQTLLTQAMAESQKSAPKDEGAGAGGDRSVGPDDELGPPRFKRLQLRVRKLVKQRSSRAGDQIKAVQWVLHKKEQCEGLTAQLVDLISRPEKLTAPEEELEELARQECEEVGDSVKTLLEVADAVDPLLQIASSEKLDAAAMMRGVTVWAGVNRGLQLGANYGQLRGSSSGRVVRFLPRASRKARTGPQGGLAYLHSPKAVKFSPR
ncbi:hypothetical protein VTH06DRAFT_8169 [Thermothelomyces fergusii]